MEERVREKLNNNPEMRGRKEMLIASIWWDELPKEHNTKEVHKVLTLIADKELSSAETIMRSMRKVLESREAWKSVSKFKKEPKRTIEDVISALGKKL